MQRIVIIGSSGAGKSTLARQLGDKLNLPVIHLDRYFWHPGWVGTSSAEWETQIKEFAQGERWILDGNYRETLNPRLEAADTVIFLDLPPWLCAWRAIKRRIQYSHRPRPDMAEGCRERLLDPRLPQFLRWVWDYPNRARPDVVHRLNRLNHNKQIVWLKTPAEVKQFLLDPDRCWRCINDGNEVCDEYPEQDMCYVKRRNA